MNDIHCFYGRSRREKCICQKPPIIIRIPEFFKNSKSSSVWITPMCEDHINMFGGPNSGFITMSVDEYVCMLVLNA